MTKVSPMGLLVPCVAIVVMLCALILLGPRRFEPVTVGPLRSPHAYGGRSASVVAREVGGVRVASELAHVNLAPVAQASSRIYAIAPYSTFSHREEKGLLDEWEAATDGELFAVTAEYPEVVGSYKNLCAPVGFFLEGTLQMVVVTDGNRFGLRQGAGKGCGWALIHKKNTQP